MTILSNGACFTIGLLCDLLWSDPDKDTSGWGENDRGVSFTFGADVVSKFLNRHDLDLICRAHQVNLNTLEQTLVSVITENLMAYQGELKSRCYGPKQVQWKSENVNQRALSISHN